MSSRQGDKCINTFGLRENLGQSKDISIGGVLPKFTDDCLLELAAILQLEELPSSESEHHAFVIFLKVIVNLRRN